jgi:hypothetical protein
MPQKRNFSNTRLSLFADCQDSYVSLPSGAFAMVFMRQRLDLLPFPFDHVLHRDGNKGYPTSKSGKYDPLKCVLTIAAALLSPNETAGGALSKETWLKRAGWASSVSG